MLLTTEVGTHDAETLADRLERGPLPFSLAVRYAYEAAKALRQLHAQGQSHGSVNCRNIQIDGSTAALLPAGNVPAASSIRADIRSFGWVLQSLFPDNPPPAPAGAPDADAYTAEAATADTPKSAFASTGVWSKARQVAARCLADPLDPQWNMQRALSELRLLFVVVRQWERTAHSLPAESRALPRERRQVPRQRETAASPPAPAEPAPAHQVLQLGRERAKPEMSNTRCPRCRAPYVHQSTPRTDFEETLELFHMPVMRCHRCSYRYFRFLRITITKT